MYSGFRGGYSPRLSACPEGLEDPGIGWDRFEIARREAAPQPLLCTEQAEKIRANDVPAPKIILHNEDLRVLCHTIAAGCLNICPRILGMSHRGA